MTQDRARRAEAVAADKCTKRNDSANLFPTVREPCTGQDASGKTRDVMPRTVLKRRLGLLRLAVSALVLSRLGARLGRHAAVLEPVRLIVTIQSLRKP